MRTLASVLLMLASCHLLTAEQLSKEDREDYPGMLKRAQSFARSGDEDLALSLASNHLLVADPIDIGGLVLLADDHERLVRLAALVAVAPRSADIIKALPAEPKAQELAAYALAVRATLDATVRIDERRGGKNKDKDREKRKGKKKDDEGDATVRDFPAGGVLDDEEQRIATAVADARTRLPGLVAAAWRGLRSDAVVKAFAEAKVRDRHPGLCLLWAVRSKGTVSWDLLDRAVSMPPETTIPAPDARLSGWDPVLPEGCFALQAAAQHPEGAEWSDRAIRDALAAKDIRLQVDAARAARTLRHPELAKLFVGHLADAAWPVLIELCAGLGEQPAAMAIAPLAARLKTTTGRFRCDLLHALNCITGGTTGLTTGDEWVAWAKAHAATFQPDPAASEAYRRDHLVQDERVRQLGGFYGLPIVSDRFSWVLDASMTMKGERMDSLRSSLRESLDGLDKVCRFNILRFSSEIIPWSLRQGTPVLSGDRAGAAKFLDGVKNTTGTRVFDAMIAASRIADIDSLIVLTDATTYFTLTGEWSSVRRLYALQSRYRPLAFNAVLFEASGRKADEVRALAAANWGRTVDQ